MPLVEYYAQSGTPAGRWLGSGLSAVGLAEGAEVTEDHLALLLGAGRHPVNGGKLSHAYPRYTTVAERVAAACGNYRPKWPGEPRTGSLRRRPPGPPVVPWPTMT